MTICVYVWGECEFVNSWVCESHEQNAREINQMKYLWRFFISMFPIGNFSNYEVFYVKWLSHDASTHIIQLNLY